MEKQEDRTFADKQFSGAALAGAHFAHCVFERCRFEQVDLRDTRFSFCIFRECQMEVTAIDGCRFQEVDWIESKCIAVDFSKCDSLFFSVGGENSSFLGCNFSGRKMRKASLRNCRIQDTHFVETDLTNAVLCGCNLRGSLFHNTCLKGADLRRAEDYSIDPRTNALNRAKFSHPEVVRLLDAFEIQVEA